MGISYSTLVECKHGQGCLTKLAFNSNSSNYIPIKLRDNGRTSFFFKIE